MIYIIHWHKCQYIEVHTTFVTPKNGYKGITRYHSLSQKLEFSH